MLKLKDTSLAKALSTEGGKRWLSQLKRKLESITPQIIVCETNCMVSGNYLVEGIPVGDSFISEDLFYEIMKMSIPYEEYPINEFIPEKDFAKIKEFLMVKPAEIEK